MNIFWGMQNLWIYFWGSSQNWNSFRDKVKVQNGNMFGGSLMFQIFWGMCNK